MSVRVCENGHVTGFRACPQCGTKEVSPLQGRQKPIPRHELAKTVAGQRVSNTAAVEHVPPPFKLWRRLKAALKGKRAA
jgi:hypothetical protein